MAEKIGFLTFRFFDGPSPSEYAAYKKLERRLEPYGRVKGILESHPFQPPMRTEAPALNRDDGARIYKLASELTPMMDEFHKHVRDVSRLRERIKYVARWHFTDHQADLKYYRHVDLLHQWITELLFERVYQRAGRYHQMWEKIAKREWLETHRFLHEHRLQRLLEGKNFSELHRKELVHPYRFEVKEPNDKKSFELDQEHINRERRVMEDAKVHMFHLREKLHDIIWEGVRQHLRHQFVERRSQFEERSRWHMHDVLRAFDKAWMHAWDSRDTFRQLVRRGVFEQAELYPRLFRKAIRDPYEIEIREPNQKDRHQIFQAHIDHERQELNLIRLEEEAARRLTKTHKLQLAAYRDVQIDHIKDRRETRIWTHDLLIDRKDRYDLEMREHRTDAARVRSQGFQLLAGRMVPQPKYGIDTDLASRVPLAMGLHGSPPAPEHVAPTPMRLIPEQQKELWHKVRETQATEQRLFIDERNQGWHERAQVIRQNMAAIDYGEQRMKELVRPEIRLQPTPEPSRSQTAIRDAVKEVRESQVVPKVSDVPKQDVRLHETPKPGQDMHVTRDQRMHIRSELTRDAAMQVYAEHLRTEVPRPVPHVEQGLREVGGPIKLIKPPKPS